MHNLIKFNQFLSKILSGNKILKITKVYNSVVNLQTLLCNNSKLELVIINAHSKLGQIPSICFQDINANDILTITKGYNCAVNLRTLTSVLDVLGTIYLAPTE